MLENITVGQILSIGGTIMGLISLISYVINPISKYNKRIETIEYRQNNDNDRLKTLESDSKMTLKTLNVMLSHMSTGNSTGMMKQQKTELEDYILNRI